MWPVEKYIILPVLHNSTFCVSVNKMNEERQEIIENSLETGHPSVTILGK